MLQKTISLIGIAAAALLLFCGGGEMQRRPPEVIDKYLQDHPDLPITDKTCIEDGRFEIGITQETLLFLLGEPKTKEVVKQPWATQEKWIYRKKGQKIFIIEDKHVVGILEKD
ncbi:MAG: hypothetical protein JXA71_17770 [Chitinispirillaceae bacterium]|nr:hypothetical protein [Chitinispirillaceae bacterium]